MFVSFSYQFVLRAKIALDPGVVVRVFDHPIEGRTLPVELKALIQDHIVICFVLPEEGLGKRPR